jgi:hypothetical protein
LPLQHAYGFELANVGAAAIKMHRQRRRASRRALRRAGQSMATVSAIELCRKRITRFCLRRHSGHAGTCRWLSTVALGPPPLI